MLSNKKQKSLDILVSAQVLFVELSSNIVGRMKKYGEGVDNLFTKLL